MYINLPFHPRNPETAELLVELITGRHLADFPAELRERVLNRCVDICNNYLREYLRIHYGPEVVGFYESFLADDSSGVGDLETLFEQLRQAYKSFTELVMSQKLT